MLHMLRDEHHTHSRTDHTIRLVEAQEPTDVQVHVSPCEEVDQPARRGDHHVHGVLERLLLAGHVFAADREECAQAGKAGVLNSHVSSVSGNLASCRSSGVTISINQVLV